MKKTVEVNVSRLRSRCASLGLDVDGSRNELVNRLHQAKIARHQHGHGVPSGHEKHLRSQQRPHGFRRARQTRQQFSGGIEQ